jgi:serine/threonine protein kinase
LPTLEELEDTLQARLTRQGIDAATVERSPGSTIVPRDAAMDTAGERAISNLDELGATTLDRKLELHATIGEGGMGIVRLATQRALGREVAVKTLKPNHKDEASVLKLLREAWVTGGLEHPNVIPIYDIARQADGTPLIVLKKIEGVDWGTLIHDARTVRDRFGADDLLDWNLRTLMQVANAVRFAHSRKVLHRDLKPENVMIGQFGEVYLVDWGIAVALEDDGTGRLPLAADALEMAGTPLYMAPEMLGGSVSKLSERSDIYLLGAILYEIVAGRPPHTGKKLMELVGSIIESDPDIPSTVPDELERIIRRAMDPDPDARFENAEQLRLAVQGFLKHRDATRLAERAQERLDELLVLLTRRSSAPLDPEDREPIYHLFGECRFGFRHALEVWPTNDAARAALDRAIAAMVEYELNLGEPEAARAHLSEMDAVPKELAARVEAARRAKDEEEAKLRKLHDEHDPSLGRRTRSFIALIVGVLWTVSPIVAQIVLEVHERDIGRWENEIVGAVYLVLLLALGYWARDSMMRTAINRQIGFAGVLAALIQLLSGIGTTLAGGTPWEAIHHRFLVWTAMAAVLAMAIDKRLFISAAGYLASYFLLPVIGLEHGFYVMAASNFVLLLNLVFLWARPKDDLEAARDGLRTRREERRRWLAERFGRPPSESSG